jgi:hypothetical protein
MAATYQLAVRTTATASGAAAAELRSTATDRLYVREIKISMAAATASIFGVGRPAAIGVTPTSPVTVLPQDPGNPTATGVIALAWGTGPTAPVAFLERAALTNVIGAGLIFSYWNGPGLIVPISSSLVIWNLQLNGVADIVFTLEE